MLGPDLNHKNNSIDLPQEFIRPAYQDNCFANIPGFIEQILTGNTTRPNLPSALVNQFQGQIESVVFIFLDAFGWNTFERLKTSSEFLNSFQSDGVITKATSQFPSTTAVHVTTMNTGLPVHQHGVLEWFYYEPIVDQVIVPLKLASYNDGDKVETLLQQGYSTEQLFPAESFVRSLSGSSIETKHYVPEIFSKSAYNRHFVDDRFFKAYNNFNAGVDQLMLNHESPGFHWLFIGNYDADCHKYGPYSKEAEQTALSILKSLAQLLTIKNNGKTLVILTADHGQVEIPENTEVLINQDIPEIFPLLRRNQSGEIIRFGGVARDLFLYAKPGSTDELVRLLKTKLGAHFEVYTSSEAIQLGLFGTEQISERLDARMPDVFILPHKGYSVGWFEPGVFERRFNKADHGGLSSEEMHIPLCMLRL